MNKKQIIFCGNCIFWLTDKRNKYGEKCSEMWSCQWCDKWKGKKSQSKNFKTYKGAEKWMKVRGYC